MPLKLAGLSQALLRSVNVGHVVGLYIFISIDFYFTICYPIFLVEKNELL